MNDATPQHLPEPGHNCVAIETAEQLSVIVDADEYFRAARAAMLNDIIYEVSRNVMNIQPESNSTISFEKIAKISPAFFVIPSDNELIYFLGFVGFLAFFFAFGIKKITEIKTVFVSIKDNIRIFFLGFKLLSPQLKMIFLIVPLIYIYGSVTTTFCMDQIAKEVIDNVPTATETQTRNQIAFIREYIARANATDLAALQTVFHNNGVVITNNDGTYIVNENAEVENVGVTPTQTSRSTPDQIIRYVGIGAIILVSGYMIWRYHTQIFDFFQEIFVGGIRRALNAHLNKLTPAQVANIYWELQRDAAAAAV